MKKIFVFLLSLLMTLSMIIYPKADGLISLTNFSIRSDNNITEFYVNDAELTGHINLELSNSGGGVIKVKADERMVNVRFSPFPNATLNETSNNNQKTAEYVFQNISSGNLMSIPFVFSAGNYSTWINNMAQTSIVVELFDLQGTLIATRNLDLTLKHRFPDRLNVTRNTYAFDGVEDAANPGYLSQDLQRLYPLSIDLYYDRVDSGWPTRAYAKAVLSVEIPPEAVVQTPVHDGWVYDQVNRIATYTLEEVNGNFNPSDALSALGYANHKLMVYFPGAQIGSFHDFNINLELTPKYLDGFTETADDGPFTLSNQYSHRIISRTVTHGLNLFKNYVGQTGQSDSFSGGYFDTISGRTNTQKWSIVSQWSPDVLDQVDLDYLYFEDTVSEKIHIVSLELDDYDKIIGPVKISVWTDYNDYTSWSVYEQSVNLTRGQRFDFSSPVYGVRVETLLGTKTKANGYIRYNVYTEFRDKSLNVTTSQEDRQNIGNYLQVRGTVDSIPQSYNNNTYSHFLVRNRNSNLTLSKSHQNGSAHVFYNTEVPYTLELNGDDFVENDQVSDFKIIDILPKGVEYVSGSAMYSFGSDQGGGNNRVANMNVCYSCVLTSEYEMKVEFINNYNNTGHSALAFDFGDLTFLRNHTNQGNKILLIGYKLKYTSLVSKGVNTNVAFMEYDAPYITDLTRQNDDIYDLDEDGLTTDQYPYSPATVNFLPPANIVIQKEVKGSKDTNYVISPSYGFSEIGTVVDYKFNVSNHFEATDVSSMSIIDILPYAQDTSLVEYQNQGDLSLIDRGSTFKGQLVREIIAPADYDVFYTTSDPMGLSVKDFNLQALWVPTLSNYSNATAFKLVLRNGSVFERNTSFTIHAQLAIPNDSNLDSNDQMINSVAFSINGEQDYVESNFAAVRLDIKEIIGSVFKDTNKNGIYDSTGDTPISNHLVALYNETGVPVNGIDGLPLTTTTDANGNYSFRLENLGNYKVKVLPPSHMNPTVYNSQVGGSRLSDTVGYFSDLVVVNETFINETMNIGYIDDEHFVTYVPNGGTPVASETVSHNETFSEPLDPTRDFYIFEGWYIDQALNNLYDFSTQATQDITLYAKWTPIRYTITFESNGGSSVLNETVNANEVFRRPTNPIKQGYVFSGWFVDTSLTREYAFSTVATQDITVYAKWVLVTDEIEYARISYESNGGSFVAQQVVEIGSVFTKPTNPTKPNSLFKGWYIDESLSVEYDFSTIASADIIVYAKWVTVEDTDDSELLPITGVPSSFGGNATILLGSVMLIFSKRKQKKIKVLNNKNRTQL